MKKNKVYAILESVDGFVDPSKNHKNELLAVADSEMAAMQVAAEAMKGLVKKGILRDSDTNGFQFLLQEDRKTWSFQDNGRQNESGRNFSWLIQPRIVQSFGF